MDAFDAMAAQSATAPGLCWDPRARAQASVRRARPATRMKFPEVAPVLALILDFLDRKNRPRRYVATRTSRAWLDVRGPPFNPQRVTRIEARWGVLVDEIRFIHADGIYSRWGQSNSTDSQTAPPFELDESDFIVSVESRSSDDGLTLHHVIFVTNDGHHYEVGDPHRPHGVAQPPLRVDSDGDNAIVSMQLEIFYSRMLSRVHSVSNRRPPHLDGVMCYDDLHIRVSSSGPYLHDPPDNDCDMYILRYLDGVDGMGYDWYGGV